MQRGVKLPEISDSIFDLIFEKTGDRAICGSIVEHNLDISGLLIPDSKSSKGKQVAFASRGETAKELEKIKMILAYMMMDKSFLDAVYGDFCIRWKPVIDKKSGRPSNAK